MNHQCSNIRHSNYLLDLLKEHKISLQVKYQFYLKLVLLSNKLFQDRASTSLNTPFLHLDYNIQLDKEVGTLNQQHSNHLQHTHHQLGKLYLGNQLYFLQLYIMGQQY